MAVSILHRITGDGLAIVGGLLFSWWLFAASSGPEYYAVFEEIMGSWIGYIVLVGLSWALFQHLLSGLRHFVLDIGAGYEVEANNMWSLVIPLLALALTAGFWALILF